MEAQNIVQNGGFEEIDFCPNSAGQIWVAEPWFGSNGSPDLFYTCGYNTYSIPQNKLGFQLTNSGNGYAAIGTYSEGSHGFNPREFLQGDLRYALQAGESYYVQFFVSQADSMQFASHNLGVTFTPTDTAEYLLCYPGCEIYYENTSVNPLTSKTDWTRVSGTFTAHGGERYIHIGNLRSDDDSEIEFIGGSNNPDLVWNQAGYYIDDIWLSHIDSAGYVSVNEQLSTNNYELKLYPNPSIGGSVTIECHLEQDDSAELMVFDMSGRRVYRDVNVCGTNAIRLEGLSEGLYHCVLVINGKTSLSEKLVILRE